ncbi:MAG: 2-hydroxychromene-2-carboxylate isomerase [Rhodospirillaceae bacterium]
MPDPLSFYFDFSSPYSFVAAQKIDALAARHGRTVDWRPFLLGVVFKRCGMPLMVEQPMKGEYSRHDFLRSMRYHGVEGHIPKDFPVATTAAARGFYWLAEADPELAVPYAKAMFLAYFRDGRPIGTRDTVIAIAEEVGADGAAFANALQDPAMKDRTRDAVEEAIARGVFGAPMVFVDGEAFWGLDRLTMVDDWLFRGGW